MIAILILIAMAVNAFYVVLFILYLMKIAFIRLLDMEVKQATSVPMAPFIKHNWHKIAIDRYATSSQADSGAEDTSSQL